jgi:queuine/archaeosine tRNA-ribosyltransferase
MLLSWANVAFYQQLMAAMRDAIADGRFAAWARDQARLARSQAPSVTISSRCDDLPQSKAQATPAL